MMLGRRPYHGASRKEIRTDILSRQEYIKQQQIPKHWSNEAVAFTNGLIQRKPSCRLGKDGIQELKNHEWFANWNWESFAEMKVKSPLKPLNLD